MRFFTDTEWSDKDQEIMKEIKNNMTNNKLTKQQEEKLKNDWGTFVGTRNYEPRAFREDCNWWIEQINSILNTEQEEECKQDCVRRYLDQKDWCKDHHTINKVVPQPISKEVEEFIEKCKKTALKGCGMDEQEEEWCNACRWEKIEQTRYNFLHTCDNPTPQPKEIEKLDDEVYTPRHMTQKIKEIINKLNNL